MKLEEDEENMFKKFNFEEHEKKTALHLQTGKKITFSGRFSQKNSLFGLSFD